MSALGSVTRWLHALQAGERENVQHLWEGYYRKLVVIARNKLGGMPRRFADEEDVALSAFDSFVRGAEQRQLPQLEDRHDLWQVLVMITRRKAINLIVYQGREIRDWRLELPARRKIRKTAARILRDLLARDPEPAFAAQMAEEYQRLLAGSCPMSNCGRLSCGRWRGSPTLRLPASWRSAGPPWNAGSRRSAGPGTKRKPETAKLFPPA